MSGSFQWRSTTPAQDSAIAAAVRSGATVVGIAQAYGISTRTVLRAIERADKPIETARLGGWSAPFAITEEGPVQIGPWRPHDEEEHA